MRHNNGLAPVPTVALLRRHGGPALLIVAITLAVGCGVTGAGLYAGLEPARAGAMGMIALTIWIALTAAPLALAAGDSLGAACRALALADAAALSLPMIFLTSGGRFSWPGVLGAYLVWAALALSAALAVRLWGNRPAAAATVVLIAALAAGSLFWSAGLLGALHDPIRARVAGVLLVLNPASAVIGHAGDEGFVWAQQYVMYEITRIGQDFPSPPASPWATAGLWGVATIAMGIALAIRHTWRRFVDGT